MNKTYIVADNIITSLGFTTQEHTDALKKGTIGINNINDKKLSPQNFYASLIDSDKLTNKFADIASKNDYTRFEQLAILSASDAQSRTYVDFKSSETLFIISTTKGSIDVLDNNTPKLFDESRLYLWKSALIISRFFKNPNKPLVISNACISGVLAIIMGQRLLKAMPYKNIVIIGADIITGFVASGFLSFKALSDTTCKPFDKNRNGLNLGEGCGTIVLTTDKNNVDTSNNILVSDGFSSNDANHISAPSRTGEGLYQVILKTLKPETNTALAPVDFISAHGTATIYNDDMEATAITRAHLEHVPTNSFKGYWGHTLGAAGVIESIISAYSLQNNILFKTAGFSEHGTTYKINIIENTVPKEINTCLKLASGFGGCNAGVILFKNNG